MIRWEADGLRGRLHDRVGGVSEGPYASLNLGRKSGDDPERVDENRRIACEAIGADLREAGAQLPGALVPRAASGAGDARRARGRLVDRRARPADPRDVRRLPADRARARRQRDAGGRRSPRRLEGAARRHRRGRRRRARGGALAAAIGPAIGPCCYDVGEEVAAPFRERFGDDVVRDGRLDLWTSAERALQRRRGRAASTASTAAPPASPRRSSRTAATRAAPDARG